MRTWQLHEAKTRFSELVRQAKGGKAQVVTKRGVASVVVLDVATYERLTTSGRSLLEALRTAPRLEADELPLERDRSPGRPIDLS